jgi:hypothetical protein
MANTFTDVVKLHYAEATQENLEKTLTAMDLAGMIDIPNGTTKNLPYVQMRATGNYTKYTNQTIQDVTTGNDTIVINTTPMVNFAMDVIDEGDNYIDVKSEIIQDASYQIKKRIDGDFFNQVLNAKWKYDANGFGRNTGTLSPITLTTGASQNISTTFGKAKAGLTNNGANGTKLALCIDDFISADLTTLGMETNVSGVADVSYTRGFQGKFGGMNAYSVSMLTGTAVMDLATQPTDGDTVTIQGVTFTFKTTLGTTAGNVLIGASADAASINLVALINAPGTTTAQGVALSSDDQATLEGVTAVDGTNLLTITSKNGAVNASSVMTNASNDFQAQVINACIMEKGAIKMALRDGVKVDSRDEPLKLVTNYFIYARYGLKVTTRSKERMVVIPLVSQAAEA